MKTTNEKLKQEIEDLQQSILENNIKFLNILCAESEKIENKTITEYTIADNVDFLNKHISMLRECEQSFLYHFEHMINTLKDMRLYNNKINTLNDIAANMLREFTEYILNEEIKDLRGEIKNATQHKHNRR